MSKPDQKASPAPATSAPKPEERQAILKGDYTIHVHLIEARGLKGRDMDAMSDPVCRVTIMGQTQNTKILRKQLNPLWDEVLVFEFTDLYPEEIERGKCVIRVFDANRILKDSLIGLYEFDLSFIYYRPHHELYRQWCALTDTTGKNHGIQGCLKASITVLGPKDEIYVHPASDADDEGGGALGVLMPPELERKGHLLKVSVLAVDELPVMDDNILGGKCDPFCTLEFAGTSAWTAHIAGKQKADILKVLQVPVWEPIMTSTIKFSIIDYDKASENDLISVLTFDYKAIKEFVGGVKPRWFPLYGAPVGYQTGVADKMNQGIVQGSWYRGRVRLGLEVEDNKEPREGTTDYSVDEGLTDEVENYRLQFDIYEGSEIPEKGPLKLIGVPINDGIIPASKAFVEIHVGGALMEKSKRFRSDKVNVTEGRCEWYQPLKDVTVSLPKDLDQCPDVFVYLCMKQIKKTIRLSYTRLKFRALVERGWRVPPAWHVLTECKALDALDTAEFPGSLLFSLRIGRESDVPDIIPEETRPLLYTDVDLSSYEIDASPDLLSSPSSAFSPISPTSPTTPSKDEPAMPRVTTTATTKKFVEGVTSKVGELTIILHSAANIPALDKMSGTSDPYVTFTVPNQKTQTSKVIKKTLAPQWNQSFTFKDVSILHTLNFVVWDQNSLKDEQMGFGKIDLQTVQRDSKVEFGKDFTYESWYLLEKCKKSDAKINLTISFTYLATAESEKIEKQQAEAEIKRQLTPMRQLTNLVTGKSSKVKQTQSTKLGSPERRHFQLRCHLYQARNLPALDSNGLADPYVVMRIAGQKIKFNKREKTLNPIWYESNSMNVNLPYPYRFAPRLQIYIFDWNLVLKNKPLGRLSLTCEEILKLNPNPSEPINPKWFSITDPEGKTIPKAEILLSFQLLDATNITPNRPINPECVKMVVEITTLGLRDLQSTLGVHKSLVVFDLPNGKQFKTRYSTKPSPQNPNFLHLLRIPIELPKSKIFAPALNIQVRDVLLGGLVERVIGTTSINLEQFMVADGLGWKPVSELIRVLTDDEVEDEKKEQLRKKADQEKKAELLAKEAKLKSTMKEVQAESKDEDAPTKIWIRSPTKDGDSKGVDKEKETKIRVKEVGEGLEDDDVKKSEPVSPSSEQDPEKEKFKDPPKYTKFDPEDEVKEEDVMEEPKYMKGRTTVMDELEDNMLMTPFHSVGLFTGKQTPGLFGGKYRKVGTYKGFIRLLEDEKKLESKDSNISTKADPATIELRERLQPVQLYCRLYVLRATGLAAKDTDGLSDPYLVVKLGETTSSTRSRHLKDTLSPDFYEVFEIPCTIPGDATLSITVMDWDGIGDDLIGTTEIDIEDRWFTKAWRTLPLKPVETRTLKNAERHGSQGSIQLWMELLTSDQARANPAYDIKPPPPSYWELRVIVWGVRDVTIKDTFTNQNDLFVTCACSVPGLKKQETDTHFRSKKGKGNFNWRMKFPISLPQKNWPRLRFQVWDLDIFSPNDSICETVMTLKGLCLRALKAKDRVKILIKGKERFMLEELQHPNFPGNQGKMEISMELLPLAMANSLPAGFGRSDPNSNPYLPEPEGRVNWSLLHPLDMLKEIFGPELYRKALCGCICMLLTAACVFMAPMIVSNVISNVVAGK